MLYDHKWGLIEKAVKSGGLVQFRPALDPDQFVRRYVWMRPDVFDALRDARMVERNAVVLAAREDFVLCEEFVVLTKEAKHRSVDAAKPDIKELKFDPPPFVEIRFRPQRRDFRLFGYFIAKDHLIIMHSGDKDPNSSGQIPVAQLRARAITSLNGIGIHQKLLVQDIKDCMQGVYYHE